MLYKPDAFSCRYFLDHTGTIRNATLLYEDGKWLEFSVAEPATKQVVGDYVVPMLPVEVHCHGIGKSDFSQFETLDLELIDEEARRDGIFCIPSVFLERQKLDAFVSFMERYATYRSQGKLYHIPGISLEGPLLASFGGTPPFCTWLPSSQEWQKIVGCGKFGLAYVVLSPDALLKGATLADQVTSSSMDIDNIAAMFLEANIKLSLGHFQKTNPHESAKCIFSILDVARKQKCSGHDIIVDHLFNDMPLKCRHAWRTLQEKERRARELQQEQLEQWRLNTLEEKLGEVPAALIRGAGDGLLTICLNFDGEHVDLDICKRVVDLTSSKAVMAMTDRTEVNHLGGQQLEKREGIGLWYQAQGIVSTGTSTIDMQMHNLRSLNLHEGAVWNMTAFVPAQTFAIEPANREDQELTRLCYVTPQGERYALGNGQTGR